MPEACKWHNGRGDCLGSYRRWPKCNDGSCPAIYRNRTRDRNAYPVAEKYLTREEKEIRNENEHKTHNPRTPHS